MSLYRQAGGRGIRVIAAALALGLIVGGVGGYLVGKGGEEEPSPAEVVADVRGELRPLIAPLELVPIEYADSVREGRVVAPTEYRASLDAAGRAIEDFSSLEGDLAVIDAAAAREVRTRLERLRSLVAARADKRSVGEATRAARNAMLAAAGES